MKNKKRKKNNKPTLLCSPILSLADLAWYKSCISKSDKCLKAMQYYMRKMKIFASKCIKNALQCFKTFICMTLQRSCLKLIKVSNPPLLQAHDNNRLRVYLYHDL